MTIELERLKVWMAENGHDEVSLRKSIWRRRSIEKFLDGTRPFNAHFHYRFGKAFGNTALRDVFGIDFGKSREAFDRGMLDQFWQPERYAANRAVGHAVYKGILPHPATIKCCVCDKQAQQYHHESYLPEDRLRVVPLCRSCHMRHHAGHKRQSLAIKLFEEEKVTA